MATRHATPFGELDLCALRDGELWCFEVKSTRSSGAALAPARRFSARQRGRVRRAAQCCARSLGVSRPARVAAIEAWLGPGGELERWRVTEIS